MMIVVFTINRLYVNYNKSNACMKITFGNPMAETEKARDDRRRYIGKEEFLFSTI